jgi:Zn-dependent M28 family amino/carboxypeptidase
MSAGILHGVGLLRIRATLLVVTVAATLPGVAGSADAQAPPGHPAGFDGEAALRYVRAQVAFGPRVPGTVAAARAGDWLVAQMRERADTVIVQRWTHTTRTGATVQMRNIFSRIRPALAERVLYVAHWDTRPVSENESDYDMRERPGDGANDGASGVGMLMALADALKRTPPSVGVDILFVDGEDYGTFGPDLDVIIGATYFAANLPVRDYRPTFGVVWDMIGDSDLRILQEGHSLRVAPQVVERVWARAAELGHATHFVRTTGSQIMDDHVPLQRLGWPVIDVIDLDYPYHHTTGDTIDKISARSLRVVGEVALALVR